MALWRWTPLIHIRFKFVCNRVTARKRISVLHKLYIAHASKWILLCVQRLKWLQTPWHKLVVMAYGWMLWKLRLFKVHRFENIPYPWLFSDIVTIVCALFSIHRQIIDSEHSAHKKTVTTCFRIYSPTESVSPFKCYGLCVLRPCDIVVVHKQRKKYHSH